MSKYLCLSFDDGPNNVPGDNTMNDMLDIMEKYNVPGSFFLIGNKITEENKKVIRRAVELGCDIQNHSWTHPFMAQMTAEQIREEYKKCDDAITEITGVRPTFLPMYLLARVIKSMGIKMVLSGEGADEIFGGYLYFHKAPDAKAFHEETVRKLGKLYLYDCLRANKSLSAWGVEGRVPFLDKEFLDVAMRTNPSAKMCPGSTMEKKIVREAFADMLPAEVAWRQKEQFSDGVGYSWIDTLKQITAEAVSDEQMAHAAERFPINPPKNKEEYYYRSIFAEHFPSDSAAKSVPSEASVACSTAIALEWDAAFKGMNDPSGRAVKGVHEMAY